MAISKAVQRGNHVYVFDEKNLQKFSVLGELQGYTQSTLSVRRGNSVYTFDEKGHQISSTLGR